MNAHRAKGGFTLIELMVVVIIIAALAGMVLPRLLPASVAAKRNIAKGDTANITVALKLYKLHHDRFPSTDQGLDVLLQASDSEDWNDSYLDKPAIDPWGRKYEYRAPGTHNTSSFDLWSLGPDEQNGDDDVNNWDE